MNKGMQKLSRSIIVSTPLVCIPICIAIKSFVSSYCDVQKVSQFWNESHGRITIRSLYSHPYQFDSTFANISHGNACYAGTLVDIESGLASYNFHLSIVSTVSFIFDFVVEICIRKTWTITIHSVLNPQASTLEQESLLEQKANRNEVKSLIFSRVSWYFRTHV